MPGEQATSLFVTLRWLAEQTETPVAPEIAARVRAPVSYPRPRRGSVDELSPRDRQAIEAARPLRDRTAQAEPVALSFEHR